MICHSYVQAWKSEFLLTTCYQSKICFDFCSLSCVRMQKLLAERSLCPHVIATTEEIIVTEHLSGKVLSEQDMLDNSELMKSLAEL